jgi:hypothetical protein
MLSDGMSQMSDPFQVAATPYVDDGAILAGYQAKVQRRIEETPAGSEERLRLERAIAIIYDGAARRDFLTQMIEQRILNPAMALLDQQESVPPREQVREMVRSLIGRMEHSWNTVYHQATITWVVEELFSRKAQAGEVLHQDTNAEQAQPSEPELLKSPAIQAATERAPDGDAGPNPDPLGKATSAEGATVPASVLQPTTTDVIRRFIYDPYNWHTPLQIDMQSEEDTRPLLGPDDQLLLCEPTEGYVPSREDPPRSVLPGRRYDLDAPSSLRLTHKGEVSLLNYGNAGALDNRQYYLFAFRAATQRYHYLLTLAKPKEERLIHGLQIERVILPSTTPPRGRQHNDGTAWLSIVWCWPSHSCFMTTRWELFVGNQTGAQIHWMPKACAAFHDISQPSSILIKDPYGAEDGVRYATMKNAQGVILCTEGPAPEPSNEEDAEDPEDAFVGPPSGSSVAMGTLYYSITWDANNVICIELTADGPEPLRCDQLILRVKKRTADAHHWEYRIPPEQIPQPGRSRSLPPIQPPIGYTQSRCEVDLHIVKPSNFQIDIR